MPIMRDFSDVRISEVVTDEGDDEPCALFLFDNTVKGSRSVNNAVSAITLWCIDQFGPMGTSAEGDLGWYVSQWNALSFVNPQHAIAFKLRWF